MIETRLIVLHPSIFKTSVRSKVTNEEAVIELLSYSRANTLNTQKPISCNMCSLLNNKLITTLVIVLIEILI